MIDSNGPDLETWWREYRAEISEAVAEAERHLEVPEGTISSIETDSDFMAVVKAYAVAEPMLNQLIVARRHFAVDELSYARFVTTLPMAGRSGKLQLAETMGVLSETERAFIGALSQVRNRYAHNIKNLHRALYELLSEEREHNGKIVDQLCGLDLTGITIVLNEEQNTSIKQMMYHTLADFLANSLNTIRPPPLPSTATGGLFGGLFAPPAQPVTDEKAP
jgi:hypothetical protein